MFADGYEDCGFYDHNLISYNPTTPAEQKLWKKNMTYRSFLFQIDPGIPFLKSKSQERSNKKGFMSSFDPKFWKSLHDTDLDSILTEFTEFQEKILELDWLSTCPRSRVFFVFFFVLRSSVLNIYHGLRQWKRFRYFVLVSETLVILRYFLWSSD